MERAIQMMASFFGRNSYVARSAAVCEADLETGLLQYVESSLADINRNKLNLIALLGYLSADSDMLKFKRLIGLALHAAAVKGHADVVQAIADRLTADQLFEILTTVSTAVVAPLHNACCNGHLQIVKSLLDKLTPEQRLHQIMRPRGSGQTPIHLCARANMDGIINEVLRYFTHEEQLSVLDFRDRAGDTPVDMAQRSDNQEATSCLIRHRESVAAAIREAAENQVAEDMRVLRADVDELLAAQDDLRQRDETTTAVHTMIVQRAEVAAVRIDDLQEQLEGTESKIELNYLRTEELYRHGSQTN